MFDDSEHDIFYAQHCLMLHWNFLKLILPNVPLTTLFGVTVAMGSSSWQDVGILLAIIHSSQFLTIWRKIVNCIGISLLQGEVDGAGALLKQEVRKE
jgi:hypothetical protein